MKEAGGNGLLPSFKKQRESLLFSTALNKPAMVFRPLGF